MVTQKLINDFLICLYKRHTAKHGDSIGSLSFTRFNIIDDSFMDELPSLKHIQDDGSFKNLTSTLLRELKARDFADGQNMEYHLTPEGYAEAKRLLNPVKHFLVMNWRIYIPIAIATIAAFTAIIRLTKCT